MYFNFYSIKLTVIKRLTFIFIFVALNIFCFAQKNIPKPNSAKLFVDYANLVSQHDEDELEHKLELLNDSTSNQIAVVTIKTLDGQDIKEVAHDTYRSWGIGTKKNNNGVLLLIAVDDRKVRIEVGYGLEGAITDVHAASIIRNNIKPAFQQGNYLGGINAAIDDIGKAASGEYDEKVERNNTESSSSVIFLVLKILFILFIIFIFSQKNKGGGYRRRGAGDWILPILFNSGGFSGFSGGGSSDSGGGGFGGFGGGDSGGGGADGSW